MRVMSVLLTSLLTLSNAAISQASADTAAPQSPPEPALIVAQNDKSLNRRRAPTEDEALALAAMEGLMSQSPQRALPVLKKVLGGTQSALVKERALFVLSQMDEPEAQAILLETASAANSPLRREAIRNIGIGGNTKSLAALQPLYAAGDSGVKAQVLEAWLIAGRKADVYQAALNAKSEADAGNAIRTLSAMGAVEELRKLGDLQKHGNSLLEAYAVAGDLTSLRKIADGPGDMSVRSVAVRSEAIRRIGIIDTDAARTALRQIYAANTNAQLREAALQGLLVSNDEKGVLSLYKAAKTTEEKRTLLRTLSIMGGDAAIQAIDAALEGKK
jgi:HEAT repeat protein